MTGTDVFLGLLVMVFHEIGHVTAAISLGIKVKRVGVSWKGMYIMREAGPPVANMITILSGPFMNLVLATAWPVSHEFALLNIAFAASNLMPIPGSDGQRALALVESSFRGRFRLR